MDTKTRVIIADAGEEYRIPLSELLAAEGDFDVVGCTGDGQAVYSLVLSEKPDVLLTDLILSGLDGLAVLEKLSPSPTRTSLPSHYLGFSSEHSLTEASNLGHRISCRSRAIFPRSSKGSAWSPARRAPWARVSPA